LVSVFSSKIEILEYMALFGCREKGLAGLESAGIPYSIWIRRWLAGVSIIQ